MPQFIKNRSGKVYVPVGLLGMNEELGKILSTRAKRDMMPDPAPKKVSKNLTSFAIPRAAIDALIDAQADAVTIGAYLTLACHTDKTGQFSTGGLKAIRENLAINRGRAEKAIHALCTIRGKATASEVPPASTSRSKSKLKRVRPTAPTIPLVYTRDTWHKEKGGELPDGPLDRYPVRHILSMF